MIKKVFAFLLGLMPLIAVASMDYNDVINSHSQEFKHLTQGVDNNTSSNNWGNVGTPNNQTYTPTVTSKTWHLNPPSDTVRTINLESTAHYTCAIARIGGFYNRGLKGFDARVYKSGSVWKLTVGNACGGCDNWADAVCWRVQ